MTAAPGGTLGSTRPDPAPRPPGVRIVLDARALQEPERAPLTAAYLEGLLEAFDDDPLPGESFALLLGSDRDDPTERYRRLIVVGRRLLPPTRLLRSGALTIDPFVLSGASIGAAWRAERSGAAGAVYHAIGGSMPLATGLPVVVTLLDLAPWELPDAYQRGAAARFGRRLRGRLLRDASAVIVGSETVAATARRLLHLRRSRIRVVPLAPRPAFTILPPAGAGDRHASAMTTDPRAERERLGLPDRYVVYSGRYDARQDLATLLRALAMMAEAGRPEGLADGDPWPPRVLFADASPADRASLARAAGREGVGEALVYAPRLDDARLAGLVRGARAALLPALSDASGLPAIEAIACGVPVVASAVGALPEIVGAAGILVEPRDPARLAQALETAVADDLVHAQLVAAAVERASSDRRTWADVARETRSIYAEVGIAG
ncbi:MAG TPA: glycosyltransferase [Candidatus Limnocylindrales bacterium]|nr:glycosyltransferase [Candidatus Limnocylindrales bacterium]